jgi:hypothetical protein
MAMCMVGCEDGPNQTYNPAPGGAGGLWNNAGPDASTNDPGSQQFDAGGGGTNAVNICTAAQQQAAWSKAFTSPIIPPFSAGGIDLSANNTFQTVTIEDIENGRNGNQQLCQGFNSPNFCLDGSGNPGYAWGESNQIATCYDVASHAVTFFELYPGYDGKATFTLPANYGGVAVPRAVAQDGSTGNDITYVWQIGQPILENGQPLDLQWGGVGPTHTKAGMSDVVANKLFLAITYTYNKSLIGQTAGGLNWMTDANYNCVSTALCRTSMNPDGSAGNFGARTVAMYADFANSNSTVKTTSASPSDIYIYPVKYMPFSFSNFNVSLDTFKGVNADPNLLFNNQPIFGPYTPAGILSPAGQPQTPFCTLYMGQTYADFKKNCMMVSGDTNQDKITLAKLLGAQHHAAEWFIFSVNGQNSFFSADSKELAAPNYVLADSEQEPPDDSVATCLFNDIRSYGLPFNDMRGDQVPPTAAVTTVDQYEDSHLQGQDLHGTAAVLGYYRQLVFDDLRNQLIAMGVTPQVDPTKCWTGGAGAGYVFPDGCTGFEMMVTPGYPLGLRSTTDPKQDTTWQDKMDLTPRHYHPSTLFRSGDPVADFMADPVIGGADDTFINGTDNLLQGSLLQATYVIGHGNINLVPPAARDWRYFLKFWGQAYVKYLLNRSQNPTWHDLYADTCKPGPCKQVNQDALFFDLLNGLDKFEYIDRELATTLGAPVDFEYEILLPASNTQAMNSYQRLTRAESALYQSMLTDKTQVPGSNENVFLTDLFGSPAINTFTSPAGLCAGLGAACWTGAVDANKKPIPGKDVWYCITQKTPDPDCPNENWWVPYFGAGSGAAGPVTDAAGRELLDGAGRPLFTNYHGAFTGTAYTIQNTIPITQALPYVQGALLALPSYANPYDMTSTNTPINVFVPHIPSQPGNGFEIPINAERSQFIQTGSLDFSGVTVTTNIDYIPQYDATSGALTGAQIAAVETQDFLGEVWPCVDQNTGDILRVKMYTSVLDIQNWLDTHPGSRSACNIFVRMSPYNNYPDYIWSNANGVLMAINPGAGGGPARVADATLFNPGLLTQTQ